MFKPLITHVLQHLISQNSWAKPHLVAHAGSSIQFDFSIAKAHLQILEDGSLAIAGETAQADATVHIAPSLALRLMNQDEEAKSYIKIEGDTHLATEVSKVLQQMRWDVEEDLSKAVGDIAAYKMTGLGKTTINEIKQQSVNAVEMLSEFWQEEKMILAKKRHVEQFNEAVDTLRNDVDRFEKRVKKLEASAKQTIESVQ